MSQAWSTGIKVYNPALYRASVIWHGQYQVVDVAASEAEPLVGMSLVYGSKLQIEAFEGGIVTIEAVR